MLMSVSSPLTRLRGQDFSAAGTSMPSLVMMSEASRGAGRLPGSRLLRYIDGGVAKISLSSLQAVVAIAAGVL